MELLYLGMVQGQFWQGDMKPPAQPGAAREGGQQSSKRATKPCWKVPCG